MRPVYQYRAIQEQPQKTREGSLRRILYVKIRKPNLAAHETKLRSGFEGLSDNGAKGSLFS